MWNLTNYIPQKQDLIILNFDPSTGKEIQKRRPAVVVSRQAYSRITGLVAVCPITSSNNNVIGRKGFLVDIHSEKVKGYINPFQLYTFDFRKRQAVKIDELDDVSFAEVVALNRAIFD